MNANVDITIGTCFGAQSIDSMNVEVDITVTIVTAEKTAAIESAATLLKKYVRTSVIIRNVNPAASVAGFVALRTYLNPSPAKIPPNVPIALMRPVVAVPPMCFAETTIDRLAMYAVYATPRMNTARYTQ